MNITIVDHPLVQHKLGLLREANVSTMKFRQITKELASLLTYEATRDFPLESVSINGWMSPVTIEQIKGKKVTIVPILRAGLGMLEGVLDLIPLAKISVVGLARNESSLEPVPYFEKLVDNLDERTALIIDPMLATGGSLNSTISLLKRKGCKEIKAVTIVAAPEGVHIVNQAHPDVKLYTAAVDSHLNQQGYIIPGLGDAGDKIFGTLPRE